MDFKSKTMRILITGATGFIGSDLSAELIDKGHQIHYLTTSKDKIKQEESYKGFLWNPAKNEMDLKSLEGVEAIINLAGHTINCKWNQTNKALILNSRSEEHTSELQSRP